MILMIMSSKNCVNLLERKRINYKRNITKIGLHRASAAHIRHLMANSHLAVAMSALAVAAPKVYGKISSSGSLEPDTCAAKPPHCNLSLGNDFVLDVFNKPCSPLGEGAVDPAFAGHF